MIRVKNQFILSKMFFQKVLLICFLNCLLLVYGSPVNVSSTSCSSLMKDAGVSDNFAFSVAHSIHSLSVRELRKFKPDVTEDNHIPTINENLNADLPILLYAPDRKGPNDAAFMTDGMKTLDEVLDHMGDSAYGIRFSNPLEMIEHAFHMKELWHMVHHAYVDLEKSPPDSRVCGCVKDIENNGLLDALRTIAMIFREPYLVYGNRLKDYETKTERGNQFSHNWLIILKKFHLEL